MVSIVEGRTEVFVDLKKVVDRTMPVFYNSVMVVNRDFSLLVLSALGRLGLDVADPLAGSGIRSLRFLNELDGSLFNKVFVNDIKPDFVEVFDKNLSLNQSIDKDKVSVSCMDANKFLCTGFFDYVEIDPFGSPNPFLDSAIRSLRRGGILSVTATDTSALCGSFVSACFRKYWALPLRSEVMHEFGLRILIRKVQLLGAQHDRALIPLVSFSIDHYMKIFFITIKGKSKVDEVLKQHGVFVKDNKEFGPVWRGSLGDSSFLDKMVACSKDLCLDKKSLKLLHLLQEESLFDSFLFFDIHVLASKLNLSFIPKLDLIILSLKDKGFFACRTHFSNTSIKTNASEDVLLGLLKNLSNSNSN